MNITPELYNNNNYLQRRDGKKLIQRIVNDLGNKHFETILDIGCGTGNLTEELSKELSHDEVIAFDISESMIEFAKRNYKRESIKYLTADICEDWHKFKSKLSLSEESVDLVISIYCFHWINDLKQAMDNISRLLKPGVINEEKILEVEGTTSDLVPFPVCEQPNEQQLLIKWQQICLNSNLQLPEIVLTHTYYPFDNWKKFQNELQALCHYLPFIPEEKKTEFMTEYFELVTKEYVLKQFKDSEYNEESSVKLNYDYITVVAHKRD